MLRHISSRFFPISCRLGLRWLNRVAHRFDSGAGDASVTAAGGGDGGTEASGAGGAGNGDGTGTGVGSCGGSSGTGGTGGTGGMWFCLIVVKRVDVGLGLVDEGVSRDIRIVFEGFLSEQTIHIHGKFHTLPATKLNKMNWCIGKNCG